MLHCTKLNEFNFEKEAAMAEPVQKTVCCIQDTVHVGTKLRNRLLVPSILLPLGNRLISVTHLKLIINNAKKEDHGLVMKDICPDDRQNFGSLEKIMSQRVCVVIHSKLTFEDVKVHWHTSNCVQILHQAYVTKIFNHWIEFIEYGSLHIF